ncbi:hypothetical protein O6H91_19G017300 [Diphasiastrum complanatum]|uniref:Uncharacterized protein n=1 Tax=Diphasiastrum complanatum TaxID=34168 RepID=A0ACC2AT82_DIPCM|nr:hypothetical protein O6H91_19G017300 [Diphasiastrum complanatum]
MVKLASVRTCRQYGPQGSRDQWENINAFVYLLATVLLLLGCAMQLPGYNNKMGLVVILISLILVVAVNLHDLYAQLAGISYRLDFLSLDPQLAFIEVAAPLVQTIGGIIFFFGVLLLFRTTPGRSTWHKQIDSVEITAFRLIVLGPALWLLGSIHNAFQVYKKADFRVQAFQKAVTIPFIIGSTLLLSSAIVALETWPLESLTQAQATAAWLAIGGSAFLVLAAIMNVLRVTHLQEAERTGAELEPLRGGAHERLLHIRQPFLAERRASDI